MGPGIRAKAARWRGRAFPPRQRWREAASPSLACPGAQTEGGTGPNSITQVSRLPGQDTASPSAWSHSGCGLQTNYSPNIFLSFLISSFQDTQQTLNRISNRIKCNKNLSHVYSVCDKAPPHRFCD